MDSNLKDIRCMMIFRISKLIAVVLFFSLLSWHHGPNHDWSPPRLEHLKCWTGKVPMLQDQTFSWARKGLGKMPYYRFQHGNLNVYRVSHECSNFDSFSCEVYFWWFYRGGASTAPIGLSTAPLGLSTVCPRVIFFSEKNHFFSKRIARVSHPFSIHPV